MRQVTGAALHRTASRLHVDPQEVGEERFFQIVVDVVMVYHPQQLVYSQDGLTHGLDEAILTLATTIIDCQDGFIHNHDYRYRFYT